ncbi:acylphosphatase-1 isoform X1 [Huso huso]|uniref:acylphosphatase n=1 Tax=Huso huso TaxID=61971 RepID=A0ABR0ZA94_HUSHU
MPCLAKIHYVCILIAWSCITDFNYTFPFICIFIIQVLAMAEKEELISVEYEIFGRVQGVFFRKYTQAEGKRLGLVGWVLNTEQGTVRGQLQGPGSKVKEMQDWLRNKGSPKSKITKAEFSNEKEIESLEHSDFRINKQKKV